MTTYKVGDHIRLTGPAWGTRNGPGQGTIHTIHTVTGYNNEDAYFGEDDWLAEAAGDWATERALPVRYTEALNGHRVGVFGDGVHATVNGTLYTVKELEDILMVAREKTPWVTAEVGEVWALKVLNTEDAAWIVDQDQLGGFFISRVVGRSLTLDSHEIIGGTRIWPQTSK